jgi:aminoglycoside/choline kinase family phosphotransferase
LNALAQAHAAGTGFVLEAMPGGASLRKFYRVQFANGTSAVGMFFPDSGRSEEVTDDGQTQTRWPFLEVLDLLHATGVRVPRLLGEDTQRGWILVEDLGDRTLAEELLRAPERKRELYQAAVRDIAQAQLRLQTLPAGCVVTRRAFDLELLLWEMDHFREYGLLARGLNLSPEQEQRFARATRAIAEQVRGLDYGFVHRDYQSRNLMVLDEAATTQHSGLLGWVDFQDALLGPRVYDLVALLNDSYQSFDDDFVRERLIEYVSHRGLPEAALPSITREFHLVTVQRKLKDAGRFVYIDRVKKDPSYLGFVEPSIAKIRRAMSHLVDLPQIDALSRLLDEVLPPS